MIIFYVSLDFLEEYHIVNKVQTARPHSRIALRARRRLRECPPGWRPPCQLLQSSAVEAPLRSQWARPAQPSHLYHKVVIARGNSDQHQRLEKLIEIQHDLNEEVVFSLSPNG